MSIGKNKKIALIEELLIVSSLKKSQQENAQTEKESKSSDKKEVENK